MINRKFPSILGAIASVLAPASIAMLVPAAPAPAHAEDAKGCISLDDGSLVNNCSYTVEVSWCSEGYDCNGQFANMHTFGAGDSYPVQGGRSDAYIRWGACRGANTITNGDNYSYSCED